MANKETILTAEGLEKLKTELHQLITVEREEIKERLAVAISHGDLSENSEYDEAKNDQAQNEDRIKLLEYQIKTAVIIDESSREKGVVSLGSKILLKDMEDGEEEVYFLVGTTEADPFANKISNESPVGSAILGKKAGDVVKVNTPAGELAYQLVNVE